MNKIKDKVKGLKYALTVDVDYAEFEKILEEKLTEYASKAKIQGFRAGKAPISVIKSKYEDSFISETINETINKTLGDYLNEKKVRPAETPKVSVESFVKGSELKFSADFEIVPEVKNIDLSKITITEKTADVKDEEVEKSLKQLAESRKSSELVKEVRPSKKGDIAVIDFEGFVDGKAFEGGKGLKYQLELGTGSFIKGFEEQIIGHKKDDEFEVNVEFPKDYHAENLKGKPAMFKVKVIDLREKAVPAIDDQLAKDMGRKDLKDLKEYIKELTQENYNLMSKNAMKDEALDELDKNKLDLPECLVEKEAEMLWNHFENAKKAGQVSEEDKNTDEKKIKDRLKKDAIKRVKLGLILAKLGDDAKIDVAQEDINMAIQQEAMKYPGQHEMVIKYYQENPQAMGTLRASIYEEKTMDYIISKVNKKSKKVSVEELSKPAGKSKKK